MSAAPVPPPTRSRTRRWLRRGGLAGAAAAVAGIVLLAWLLATAGGRDVLLVRIVGLLPPGALTWERADGVVHGPLVLHDVRYRDAGIEFTAKRVLLDPDLLPVLGRRLQLDRLEVDGAVLALPAAADEPFALPRWPEALPRIPMPIDLRATRLAVRGFAVRRDGAALFEVARADGAQLQFVDDGFRVGALELDGDFGHATLRGEYLPGRAFRSDLTATLRRPARDDAAAVALRLAARGDLEDLTLSLTGTAPGAVDATLTAKGDADAPVWTLKADAEALDPALFGRAPGPAWRGHVAAAGRGGAGTVEGEVVVVDVAIGVARSDVSLVDGVLHAAPLRIVLPQGRVDIAGTLRVEGDVPVFDVAVRSDALRLEPEHGEAGSHAVSASGELSAQGTFDAWTIDGDATLRREAAEAAVTVHGTGDRDAVQLRTLHVRTPDGELAGSGRVQWSPAPAFALDARLSGFDPGFFWPDYPGAAGGTLVADGVRDDAGHWRGSARIDGLSGQLRGRALSGRAHAHWNGDRGDVDAAVGLGDSRVHVTGAFGDVLALDARFAPLHLADLVAGGSGRVEGVLSLHGPAEAFDIAAELRGAGLRWNDMRAGTLEMSGRLPARGDGGDLRVRGGDVVAGGIALDRLSVDAAGSQAALRLDVTGAGAAGELTLAGRLAREGAAWRGRVESLRVAPARGPRLALDAPFAFRVGGGAPTFERACLRAVEAGGRACAVADGRRIVVDAEAVPVALLQPWLPVDEAVPMQAFGVVDATLELRRAGTGWNGGGTLRSATGGLRLAEALDHEVFAWRDLQATATVAGDALSIGIDAGLAAGGRVAATLRGGLAATAPLVGRLELDVRDLAWLELFSEDLAAPQGVLTGTLAIAGTRAAPEFSGTADLAGFSAELPGLGLKLRDGDFDLVGRAGGQVRVVGRVTSGDGVLALDGSLDFRDARAPLTLALDGQDVTVASTPELFLVADPDLTLRWLPDLLEVRGTLAVDEARVDLELLDSSVAVSPDVVVVDPAEAPGEGTRERPLDLEVAVRLGDDVRLSGFGLDGRMTGAVALRQRPSRRATATGTLDVAGTYRAYGQSLVIERARLGFADSPFDDPTLDIRAEREFDDATVGVQVRGTARRPQTSIVSSPAMETSEALSWLVFGRPMSTTTGGESRQLGAAALALGAGGNLVAQQLGTKLGLDEAGVADSRNLGGATLTIGKYVSPRLFLSYGVSLIGTGQVVTLKYLLSRGFDISVESGNENAASVNWRTER